VSDTYWLDCDGRRLLCYGCREHTQTVETLWASAGGLTTSVRICADCGERGVTL
jgi:hypothetical protein